MPIRVPLTWMGETPLSAKPRLASERMEPDSPILPVAAGSLPSSSPVREGHGEPVTGASQNLRGDAGALDGLPVDERVVRRLEAALEPPSRQGIAGLGATRGDGAGVCKATRSRTRSRPSDCRVAPSPAQTSAAAPATAVGEGANHWCEAAFRSGRVCTARAPKCALVPHVVCTCRYGHERGQDGRRLAVLEGWPKALADLRHGRRGRGVQERTGELGQGRTPPVEAENAIQRALVAIMNDDTRRFGQFSGESDSKRWLTNAAFRPAHEATD